jgi:WD40 repeat protein
MSKRTVSQPQEQYAEMRTSEGAGPGPGSQSQAASTPGSMGYSLLQAHSGPVYGADFSPDVQFLLSSSADTTGELRSVTALLLRCLFRMRSLFAVPCCL